MSRRRIGARFTWWWMAIIVVLIMGVCGVSQGVRLNLGSTLCLWPGSIYYEFFHDEFAGMSNWANGTWSWMGGTPNWKLTQSSRPNTQDAVLAITWQQESLFMSCADDPPVLLMSPGSSTYAAECSLWLPAMAPGNPGYPLQKYKEAGIVVYQDEDNYIFLGYGNAGCPGTPCFEARAVFYAEMDGVITKSFKALSGIGYGPQKQTFPLNAQYLHDGMYTKDLTTLETRRLYLRLEANGDHYTAFFGDGDFFVEIATIDAGDPAALGTASSFAPQGIGLTVTGGNVPNSVTAIAEFGMFDVVSRHVCPLFQFDLTIPEDLALKLEMQSMQPMPAPMPIEELDLRLENAGSEPLDGAYEIGFVLDGELVATAPGPWIEPGEAVVVDLPEAVRRADSGRHTLEILLDHTDRLAEGDESNNKIVYDFYVGSWEPDPRDCR